MWNEGGGRGSLQLFVLLSVCVYVCVLALVRVCGREAHSKTVKEYWQGERGSLGHVYSCYMKQEMHNDTRCTYAQARASVRVRRKKRVRRAYRQKKRKVDTARAHSLAKRQTHKRRARDTNQQKLDVWHVE